MKFIEPGLSLSPRWAGGAIGVQDLGEVFVVTGQDPPFDFPRASLRFGELDPPLSLGRRVQEATTSGGDHYKSAPHIRFANAHTDALLKAFLTAWGPVDAEEAHPEGFGGRLVARQRRSELQREQRAFAALTEIIRIIGGAYRLELRTALVERLVTLAFDWKRPGPDGGLWRERAENARRGEVWNAVLLLFDRLGLSRGIFADSSPENRAAAVTQALELDRRHVKTSKRRGPRWLFDEAHVVACMVLGTFRGELVSLEVAGRRRVLRVSGVRETGIRAALYEMLRHDFVMSEERGTLIGRCASASCQDFFRIERRGLRWCNPLCSQRDRQRDYAATSGNAKRRLRRAAKRRRERSKAAGFRGTARRLTSRGSERSSGASNASHRSAAKT